jgi:hypothetical protein
MDESINVYDRININHVKIILMNKKTMKFYFKYLLDPPQPSQGGGTRGSYYINQTPYDARGSTPLNIVLDGSRPEQRVPLQVLVND